MESPMTNFGAPEENNIKSNNEINVPNHFRYLKLEGFVIASMECDNCSDKKATAALWPDQLNCLYVCQYCNKPTAKVGEIFP